MAHPAGTGILADYDSRYAQQTADLVDHWSHANPYGRGINWSSSLEVAYRVISWTWAFVLLRDAAVLSASSPVC